MKMIYQDTKKLIMSYFDFSIICLKEITNCQSIILVNILIKSTFQKFQRFKSNVSNQRFKSNSENALLQVLNNMSMDKSLTSNDGLAKELYQFFCLDIKSTSFHLFKSILER